MKTKVYTFRFDIDLINSLRKKGLPISKEIKKFLEELNESEKCNHCGASLKKRK